MSYTNRAAWLPFKSAKPLKVGSAPYTPPGPGQIVVQNRAVAINKVDWGKQIIGDLGLNYIKYPFILGGDVAGIVVAIGPGVQRFRIGDRVLGSAVAISEESNNPAEGAFQSFTVIREHLAAPLPDHVTFERASVLPLCLSTAAYGLFHSGSLALGVPELPASVKLINNSEQRRVVLITAGASSVGCCAIQLASAAGYEVLSTASPKNFDYVKKLGAEHVFDYRSATLVDDILAKLPGRNLMGAYAIGEGAIQTCCGVLKSHKGPKRMFVADAGGDFPVHWLDTPVGIAGLVVSMMWSMGKAALSRYMSGVQVKFVDGKDLCDPDGVVGRVYCDYLPRALAERRFVPAPEPLVVGKGLDKIQEAMDRHLKGVSAKKVVVSL
ncbi:GroES-like protein [Xylaria sp. FL1777]|nr:GroES-like protein [Xylaria sp. FL1777]